MLMRAALGRMQVQRLVPVQRLGETQCETYRRASHRPYQYRRLCSTRTGPPLQTRQIRQRFSTYYVLLKKTGSPREPDKSPGPN